MAESTKAERSRSKRELQDGEPIGSFLLLDISRRRAALQQLANFEPRTNGFSKPDADEIIEASGVAEDALRETYGAAQSFYEQGASIGELLPALERFCARHPDVDRAAAETDLKTLTQLSAQLDARFDEVIALSFALPTAETLHVACDLRVMSRPGEDLRLRPVAIVRIALDEGAAMTFQCTPLLLARMRSELARAEATLRRLDAVAASTSKVQTQ